MRLLATASTTPRWQDWIERQRGLLLALIMVVAAWFRFHSLAAKSFWLDEGFSVGVGRLGWGDFGLLLWHREANMTLYYLLLRFWLRLGSSEFSVRSLSVLFALATIPVIYALGARVFRPRIGLLAAFLLAINAFSVRYSQEARGYALLVLLTALASWLFVRGIEDRNSNRWWPYTLCSILLIYCHFYGVLVLAAQCVSVLLLPGSRPERRDFFRQLRFVLYAIAPLAFFLVRVGGHPMDWIPQLDGHILAHFFRSLAGNGGYLLLAACGIAWAIAAFSGWRLIARQPLSLGAWHHAFLLISFAFPMVAVGVGCYFRPMFLARYLLVCLPGSVVLAADGIVRCRPKWLATALLVLIAALSIRGIESYYRADFDLARDDWRSATSYVLKGARPGDGIFFYSSGGRMTFDYYRGLSGFPPNQPQVIYPSSGTRLTYRDFLVTPLAEVLQELTPDQPRVWLFLSEHRNWRGSDMGSAVMRVWYGRRYHLVSTKDFGRLEVLLYSREPVHPTANRAVSTSLNY